MPAVITQNAVQMHSNQVVAALAKIPLFVQRLVSSVEFDEGDIVLAGGAVRDSMKGVAPRDFDLFTQSESVARRLAELVGGRWAQTSAYTYTAWRDDKTIWRDDKMIVQACYGWKWSNPEVLLDKFDFTVCQAAIWLHRGEWVGIVGEHFEEDLRARRLRLVNGLGSTTLERVIRIYSKGFTPDAASGLSGGESDGACYYHQRADEVAKLQARVAELEKKLESEELLIRRVNAKVRNYYGDQQDDTGV